jgi:hypothetical protein
MRGTYFQGAKFNQSVDQSDVLIIPKCMNPYQGMMQMRIRYAVLRTPFCVLFSAWISMMQYPTLFPSREWFSRKRGLLSSMYTQDHLQRGFILCSAFLEGWYRRPGPLTALFEAASSIVFLGSSSHLFRCISDVEI